MRWMTGLLCTALALACARDESSQDARDVTETGAATDVIGRPEGAESIPPQMTDRDPEPPLPAESLPSLTDDSTAERTDTGYKRPERRPIRKVPPLTRPDSGKP